MVGTIFSRAHGHGGHARATVTDAFSSWDKFKLALQVKNTLSNGEAQIGYVEADPLWMNEAWGFMTYASFYFGLAFTKWSLGATMIGIGLNWWQSIVVIFVSQTISAVVMALNSRAAATYHLGYPAICRAVFGLNASYYFVGARAVLAAIWYGIQLYFGASLVSNMLRAIFGDAYKNIPNHIPSSVGISTKGMLSFFLFWLIHFFFCLFRPYQLRKFFWFKGFLMLPAVIGMFTYCMIETNAKVGGKLQQSKASVAAGMGWPIMHAINSGMGNTATLITNQPDIARWSKNRKVVVTAQLLVQPLACTLAATFGILSTAAINGKWGLQLWNLWDLLDAVQDHHNHPAARFAIFLAAFAWTIGILGTNIAANMISFGADVALLWPRYIDMKRGFFIVQFLSYAIVPWKIMSSALVFTNFLSGYGLFMASVVAIMLADYFVTTKGNIMTAHLFNPGKSNQHYRYHKGWNLQALIAYIVGIALPFPGFVATLGAHGVNKAGKDLFYLGWMLSFVASFVIYILICAFWPTQNQKLTKKRGMTWEESARIRLEGRNSDAQEEVIINDSKERTSASV